MLKLKFSTNFLSHYRRNWKPQMGRRHFGEGFLPVRRGVRQVAGRRGPGASPHSNADTVKIGFLKINTTIGF